MAKPKPEKKREPEGPAPTKVLPMQLRIGDRLTDETGTYEVVARPYTTAGRENRERPRQESRVRRHDDAHLGRA